MTEELVIDANIDENPAIESPHGVAGDHLDFAGPTQRIDRTLSLQCGE